jgi:predicted Zn finger-like uncharacterized protein
MSIITKCPGCGTTFRVTPHQLQAQHGMVRCGRCANVFDGFKTLATLSDVAPLDVEPPAVARADAPGVTVTRPPAEVRRESVNTDPAAAPPQEAPPAAPPEAAPPLPPLQEAQLSQEPAAVSLPEDIPARGPVTIVQDAAGASPFAPIADVEPVPRRRSGGWTLGAMLLLVGLAAQGAYLTRSEIAASVPEARPYLNKMCELLRCMVALPQRPRQISIEASDMQATDPANPGVIALTATLRNNATTELGYPALDVVLTNTKEHTVARRIFLPADYLAANREPRAGIAPNAELTVRLDLDTGDLGAAGFRLDVLAAPAR